MGLLAQVIGNIGNVGAGPRGKWRRCGKKVYTCATAERTSPFPGAGPHPKSTPAPKGSGTCTMKGRDLRHRPIAPAPGEPEHARRAPPAPSAYTIVARTCPTIGPSHLHQCGNLFCRGTVLLFRAPLPFYLSGDFVRVHAEAAGELGDGSAVGPVDIGEEAGFLLEREIEEGAFEPPL